MAKQGDYVRYTIRVPADLYERVQKAAGEKSVNAEIVAALEEKYPAPEFEDIMVEIERLLDEAPSDEAKRDFLQKLMHRLEGEIHLRTDEMIALSKLRTRK